MRWFSNQADKPASAKNPANGIRPVLSAETLLATRQRGVLLQEIQSLVSIPERHYSALFDAAITNYARFVQELPASEIHHHSAPGGMLDHGLEVTKGALAIRRGHMLPPGAEPEALAKQADRWTYAVFAGALLHDIGKPAVDQVIQIFFPSKKPLGQWIPWNGPMAANHHYHMDFIRPRRYELHPRVGAMLAHHIIPPIGLAWLSEDQELFEPWICLVSGDMESAGVLGQIIHEADGRSVARNLGAGDVGQFPSARTTPLHKKLLTGLRYLIAEGHLPLNRNGAAGWLDHDDLWLVSKRTVDALRDHLHQEGHTDIPSRNDRIFDVLKEHAIFALGFLIESSSGTIPWSSRAFRRTTNSHLSPLFRFVATCVSPAHVHVLYVIIRFILPLPEGANQGKRGRKASTNERQQTARNTLFLK